jgi:signal transduction histidine kinase
MGEFYLSELVDKITVYYRDKLELVKTNFHVDSYGNCLLKGDSERCIEVLQNIVENAIKYGDGSRISLHFSEEDGCVLICVRNTGCTLPDTELPHIFDSFWRGSNAEKHSGSGLGLYICRQLMHKMGGEIFAQIKDDCMMVTAVFPKA